MSDDLGKRNAPDDLLINMNQEYEIRYWTQKFKVSREDLRRAIDAVGPMAAAVEKRLGRGNGSR